jgi:hypothetical protein
MKKYLIIFSILLYLFVSSCKEDPSNPTNPTIPAGEYTVNGKLIYEGNPFPGATVSLDNRSDLTTRSDSQGEFSIVNVPEGEYELGVYKVYGDGAFITKSIELTVHDSVTVSPIIIARIVRLLNPIIVGSDLIKVIWNSTDATDFSDYKLYRHTNPDFDETTGTLIHTSTAISDTQFTDNVTDPQIPYYYRVYYANDYEKLGGSNIVSSTPGNISGMFITNIGAKFYYKGGHYPNDGFYESVYTITEVLGDGRIVVSVKNYYIDSTTNNTVYWKFSDNKFWLHPVPGYLALPIYDANILNDTCFGEQTCYKVFDSLLFNQNYSCQYYHYFVAVHGIVARRWATTAKNIGMYSFRFYGTDGWSYEYTDSIYLIGFYDGETFTGDSILNKNSNNYGILNNYQKK